MQTQYAACIKAHVHASDVLLNLMTTTACTDLARLQRGFGISSDVGLILKMERSDIGTSEHPIFHVQIHSISQQSSRETK